MNELLERLEARILKIEQLLTHGYTGPVVDMGSVSVSGAAHAPPVDIETWLARSTFGMKL